MGGRFFVWPQTSVWKKAAIFVVVALSIFSILSASPLYAAKNKKGKTATETIVQGTVKTTSGDGIADVTVEFHNGDGSFSESVDTDSDGAYTFLLDPTTVPSNSNLTLEVRPVDGYANPGAQHVLYDGTAQTAHFILNSATKIIHITVQDTDGNAVGADAVATPFIAGNQESVSINGTGDIEVPGGKWIVSVDANLSESSPQRYPWMSITGAQEVEFAEDETVEEASLTFEVVNANQLVSVTMTDKNGDVLTEDSFRADVTFRGFNKQYGPIATRRKVNSSGLEQVYLLPGVYTLDAYHTQLEGQSFKPSEITFVVPESSEEGAVELGTIQAVTNSAIINGIVAEHVFSTEGKHAMANLDNVDVTATHLHSGRTYTGATNGAGEFSIANLPLGDFSVTVKEDGYIPVESATVTITEENETVSGLTLEAIQTDVTIEGFVTNGDDIVINESATIIVEENGMTYTGSLNSDGSFSIDLPSGRVKGDKVKLQLITQPGSSIFATEDVMVDVVPGETATTEIPVSDDEGTITGTVVNTGGDEVDSDVLGTDTVVFAMHNDGSVERATVEEDGSFTMNVGPGKWKVAMTIDDIDATALTTTHTTDTVTVDTDETTTGVELVVHETAGTVEGVVQDPQGDEVSEAPVYITNLPALEAEAKENKTQLNAEDIIAVVTTTDAEGGFVAQLPAGDYTAFFGSNPNTDTYVEPESTTFTVEADDTVTVDTVQYTESESTISGDIPKGLESVHVTAYTDAGGTQTAELTDGDTSFELGVSEGDWTVVISGVKNGELWTGEKDVTVDQNQNNGEVNIAVQNTAIDFPATVITTGDADETIVVSNLEGAQFILPPYAAAYAGEVEVELTAVPEITVQNGVTQVGGFSYEAKVLDPEGFVVTDLNVPATLILPVDSEFSRGYENGELTGSFFVEGMEIFSEDGVIASVGKDQIKLQTDHLTRFTITTSGTQKKVKPLSVKTARAKNIAQRSALLTWKKPVLSTVKNYTVQVKAGKEKKNNWDTYTGVSVLRKTVDQLSAGTSYTFRVKACNDKGCSAYSPWKKFKTKK